MRLRQFKELGLKRGPLTRFALVAEKLGRDVTRFEWRRGKFKPWLAIRLLIDGLGTLHQVLTQNASYLAPTLAEIRANMHSDGHEASDTGTGNRKRVGNL
jgi:hypothetical protein